MEHAGPGRALVSDRAGFGHAVVVEDDSARPGPLDARARCRNAAPGLARNNDQAQPAGAQVHSLVAGNLAEVLGVGGGAAEHR